ncbi:hypothetical protein PATY110618_20730 [Paenibacillus typhae]|uniref:Uncharacterized protein n=1 Tax=Paenibacillus typhae TaxID=1174501 RepID=A0A1G9A2T9_9BACL|nr:hypothetical protein SAMN05216192_13515 [Paenibacillus typhae]
MSKLIRWSEQHIERTAAPGTQTGTGVGKEQAPTPQSALALDLALKSDLFLAPALIPAMKSDPYLAVALAIFSESAPALDITPALTSAPAPALNPATGSESASTRAGSIHPAVIRLIPPSLPLTRGRGASLVYICRNTA